jgi:RNA polymerase-binding transcription factor DksA
MDSGDFGVCGQCEGVISRKRLEALPWAALCITCQEQLDSIAGRRGGVEEQVA